jgi:hypothetical protein
MRRWGSARHPHSLAPKATLPVTSSELRQLLAHHLYARRLPGALRGAETSLAGRQGSGIRVSLRVCGGRAGPRSPDLCGVNAAL